MSGTIKNEGKVTLDYIKQNPTMAKRALAKKMRDELPDMFASIENARGLIKHYTGASGSKALAGLTNDECVGSNSVTDLAKTRGRFTPKILLFDIETSPNLAWVWGCFKQNIGANQMVQYTDTLCYAAKWLGKDKIYFESRQNDEDDKRVSVELWKLFDEADIVVAHNGRGFDVKMMNTRWLAHGFHPPSPYKSYDTLQGVKRQFRFPRNKLDVLARYLNIGKKLEHEGFDLWMKCMNTWGQHSATACKKAWIRMKKYNIEDVRLLEELYVLIRPWDTKHPNIALMYDDMEKRCMACGCRDMTLLTKESFTNVSVFDSYRCCNCGKIMRSGESTPQTVMQGKKKVKKQIMRHSM